MIKTHVRKFAKESKISDENTSDTTDTDLEDEEPLISDEEEKNLDSSDSEELMTLSELRERKLSRENNDEFADVENEKKFKDSDQEDVSSNPDLNQPVSSPEEIEQSSYKERASPSKKVGNRKYGLGKVNGSPGLSSKRLAVLRRGKAKLDAKSSVYKATHYGNLRAKRVTEKTKKRKYTKPVKETYTFPKANERNGKPVLQSLVLKRKPGRPRKDESNENNVEIYHGKKTRVVVSKPRTFKHFGTVVPIMKRNKLQTIQKGNYQPPKLLVHVTSSLSCDVAAVGTQCSEYFEICIQSKQFNNSMVDDEESDSAPTNIPEETQPYRNFITLEVMEDITACLRKAEDDLSKAVLLCAKGSIFSYGLDVEDLMEHENPQKVLDALRRMIDSFIRFPKPIIAAVQGPCASLGASILGLCDLVVASNKAAIQMPYTLQGLTPDSCSSYLLPTIVGAQQANSLLLGNKILTAFEAHQIGYFTEVVSHEELMGSVMNHMNSLRFAALPSIIATKKLLKAPHIAQLVYVNDSEIRNLSACLLDPQCQSNMRTFVKSMY
uniref:uncharacterized protein LOC100185155 isoform X2 n=1 Tax=Ciona intestinalis TaxID=7719 RepID=UPI000180BD34|nr:uncharacterized protein LOC100185155 isoform X2 [Ciona intestinalis]|eukprot:XP_002121486.2 uncharacterized protein LOC100185155 isoform X2 [Ciona intestinalis]